MGVPADLGVLGFEVGWATKETDPTGEVGLEPSTGPLTIQVLILEPLTGPITIHVQGSI